MWIEVEESELTDNLRKFLQFRCREARETEWLKNEFGTTWGCSDVYNLPGIKYEIISFLTNEDAYVLRYWKGGLMNNKLIKLFKDHIHFPDDYTKLHWKEEYGCISYNTDNELSDLMQEEGNTYSGEVSSKVEIDDYVMYELDSGCGWNYQAIFSLSNKVDINAYWESEGE